MFTYLNFDFVVYKVSMEITNINDSLRKLWVKLFNKNEEDNGYTIVDKDNDRYLTYEELWEL
jgi:hypothetical protein